MFLGFKKVVVLLTVCAFCPSSSTKREAKSIANQYLREVGRAQGTEDLEELEIGESQL